MAAISVNKYYLLTIKEETEGQEGKQRSQGQMGSRIDLRIQISPSSKWWW